MDNVKSTNSDTIPICVQNNTSEIVKNTEQLTYVDNKQEKEEETTYLMDTPLDCDHVHMNMAVMEHKLGNIKVDSQIVQSPSEDVHTLHSREHLNGNDKIMVEESHGDQCLYKNNNNSHVLSAEEKDARKKAKLARELRRLTDCWNVPLSDQEDSPVDDSATGRKARRVRNPLFMEGCAPSVSQRNDDLATANEGKVQVAQITNCKRYSRENKSLGRKQTFSKRFTCRSTQGPPQLTMINKQPSGLRLNVKKVPSNTSIESKYKFQRKFVYKGSFGWKKKLNMNQMKRRRESIGETEKRCGGLMKQRKRLRSEIAGGQGELWEGLPFNLGMVRSPKHVQEDISNMCPLTHKGNEDESEQVPSRNMGHTTEHDSCDGSEKVVESKILPEKQNATTADGTQLTKIIELAFDKLFVESSSNSSIRFEPVAGPSHIPDPVFNFVKKCDTKVTELNHESHEKVNTGLKEKVGPPHRGKARRVLATSWPKQSDKMQEKTDVKKMGVSENIRESERPRPRRVLPGRRESCTSVASAEHKSKDISGKNSATIKVCSDTSEDTLSMAQLNDVRQLCVPDNKTMGNIKSKKKYRRVSVPKPVKEVVTRLRGRPRRSQRLSVAPNLTETSPISDRKPKRVSVGNQQTEVVTASADITEHLDEKIESYTTEEMEDDNTNSGNTTSFTLPPNVFTRKQSKRQNLGTSERTSMGNLVNNRYKDNTKPIPHLETFEKMHSPQSKSTSSQCAESRCENDSITTQDCVKSTGTGLQQKREDYTPEKDVISPCSKEDKRSLKMKIRFPFNKRLSEALLEEIDSEDECESETVTSPRNTVKIRGNIKTSSKICSRNNIKGTTKKITPHLQSKQANTDKCASSVGAKQKCKEQTHDCMKSVRTNPLRKARLDSWHNESTYTGKARKGQIAEENPQNEQDTNTDKSDQVNDSDESPDTSVKNLGKGHHPVKRKSRGDPSMVNCNLFK